MSTKLLPEESRRTQAIVETRRLRERMSRSAAGEFRCQNELNKMPGEVQETERQLVSTDDWIATARW